jgi:hypothetical protein
MHVPSFVKYSLEMQSLDLHILIVADGRSRIGKSLVQNYPRMSNIIKSSAEDPTYMRK